ncbi:hypothetical protein POM88_023525 [Heracleum sosnowskyi]|uniref:Uncharacterized protein n=1 Tax=Heracleum sosnowskyi TaxID=360622 RepID=A0AAD8IHH5_9APIA|nr:hypothetical protein POM88_023525 [Heracleum sosnowskyi]
MNNKECATKRNNINEGSQEVPLDFSSLWGSTFLTSTSSTIGSEIISEEAITQACGKQIQLMGFDLDVPASMVDNATQDGAPIKWWFRAWEFQLSASGTRFTQAKLLATQEYAYI